MADLGCIPSRNSLTITSTTGDRASVPGATTKSAGCMTAEHAAQLERLWTEHETKDGPGTVIIERPAPRHDGVTRDELRQIVSGLQRTMAQIPAPTPAPLVPIDNIESRLAEVERREMDLALRVEQLFEAFSRFVDIVETKHAEIDQQFGFIDRNVVASVEARAA